MILAFLIGTNIIIHAEPRGQEVRIPILLYHHVNTEVAEETNMLVNITPERLREHFTLLKERGYTAITTAELEAHLRMGSPLPSKPVLITFDDGYTSNYAYAYPLLRELGMKATIFIVTDSVGKSEGVSYPHFTWDQAREMQSSGVIDIQSHTCTHADLANTSYLHLQKELRYSRYVIERQLGKQCHALAYPYGFHSENLQFEAERAGYRMQMLVENEWYITSATPSDSLKRMTVSGDWSAEFLLSQIEQ